MARLARLDLNENEMVALQGELNALIGHFGDIQGIDASEFDPESHAVALQNIWSEDFVDEGLPRYEALKNSALSRGGLFVVPTIIED